MSSWFCVYQLWYGTVFSNPGTYFYGKRHDISNQHTTLQIIAILCVPIMINAQTFTWQGCLGLQSGRWHGSQHLRSTVKATQERAVKLVAAEWLELRLQIFKQPQVGSSWYLSVWIDRPIWQIDSCWQSKSFCRVCFLWATSCKTHRLVLNCLWYFPWLNMRKNHWLKHKWDLPCFTTYGIMMVDIKSEVQCTARCFSSWLLWSMDIPKSWEMAMDKFPQLMVDRTQTRMSRVLAWGDRKLETLIAHYSISVVWPL